MPITYGAHTTSGRRLSYQHDRVLAVTTPHAHIFGVFDGHGTARRGHVFSQLCATRFVPLLEQSHAWRRSPHGEKDDDLIHALKSVVASLEREAFEMDAGKEPLTGRTGYPGTTMCVAVIKDGWLYCLNVGDSRAVLACSAHTQQPNMYNSSVVAEQMTVDHTCDHPAERRRIEDAGGFVINGRLNGKLNMSRSIGDFEFKQHRNSPNFNSQRVEYAHTLLVPTPDVSTRRLRSDDLFLVLGTDGLFTSRVTNEMVVLQMEANLLLGKGATEMAEDLVRLAIDHQSEDNISAVVVKLNDLPRGEPKTAWWRRKKTFLSEVAVHTGTPPRDQELDIDRDLPIQPQEMNPLSPMRLVHERTFRFRRRRLRSRPPNGEVV